MKKIPIIKATSLFLLVLFVSASMMQCKKEGNVVQNLDRSYTGGADSTVYASFYENNTITPSDVTPGVNDMIKFRGVQTIIHEFCATSNCHGGPISPRLDTYAEIASLVNAGNPEGSKLWEYVTTNDFNKAMPPVNSNHELNTTDKGIIYNWIKNGAKEKPDLADFRPAAIRMIVDGCGSANCHSQSTAVGGWARKGLVLVNPGDTFTYTYNPPTGSATVYCQISNTTLLNREWNAYKDSVKKFYLDTLGNASSRPYKTLSLPVSAISSRMPFNNYDDIILGIKYPKSMRSVGPPRGQTYTPPVYIDPLDPNKKYWVRGNYLNSTDCFIRRIDSTLMFHNVVTAVAATKDGSMAWDDGGLKPSEVALIKAWYFADPNIPDVWKYGNANVGIFKYILTGNFIKRP